MRPEYIFYSGIALCLVAGIGAFVSVVWMKRRKSILDRQLDAEYGKRRAS